MAGQDELIYRIVYKVDEQSLQEIKQKVQTTQEEIKQSTPESILPEAGQVVQTANQIEEANKKGIQSLVQLNNQLNEYRGELKELQTLEKLGLNLSDEQRERQEELKVQIKATSSEYNQQSRNLASLQRANTETANTYQELVDQNRAISAEIRNLPLDDTSGRLQELQEQYKANNDRLKEFDATMGNHQRNVGDYEGAIKRASVSLNNLEGETGQVGKGVGVLTGAFRSAGPAFTAAGGGVKGFGLALKATGIGLFLPILAALVGTFSKLQPVVDTAQRVLGAFSTTLAVVGDRVLLVVKSIKQFISGDFSGAVDTLKSSFTGLGDEIAREVRINDQLIESLRKLRYEEFELTVQRAKANKELAEAKLRSRDETLVIGERIKALEEALEIENQIAQQEMDIAQRRFEALQAQVDLNTSSEDEIRQLREAEARVLDLQTQSIMRQGEAVERINTLKKEQIKLTEEQAKAEEESANAVDTRVDKEMNALAKAYNLRLNTERDIKIQSLRQEGEIIEALTMEQEKRKNDLVLQFQKEGLDKQQAETVASQQARLEFEMKFAKARAEISEKETETKIASERAVADSAMSIAKSLFGQNKAVAIAETTLNTFRGAQAAFAQTPGPIIVKALAASAAIAQGLANIRSIMQTDIGSSAGTATMARASGVTDPLAGQVRGVSQQATEAIGAIQIPGLSGFTGATREIANMSGTGSMLVPQFNIQATVDRRGLAIAVRDGEREIRNDSILY